MNPSPDATMEMFCTPWPYDPEPKRHAIHVERGVVRVFDERIGAFTTEHVLRGATLAYILRRAKRQGGAVNPELN
ncbi:MAG: hypothetical protein JO161_09440 [Planctomycetaceae bacterium]|nr:hypothetical protein [Planctomycetaceae bacterium]